MSTSQRVTQSPGGAASPGESTKAGAPYKSAGPPAPANLPTSGIPRAHATSSSVPMIGQIPSLYDPSMAIPPEGLDYQQWVDNYSSGQYATYAQGGLPGNVTQVPFQQPSQQQQAQSQLHHIQTTAPNAAPTQNRYNFVQEPYATGEQSASYDPQFVSPVPGDRPQRGMPRISRRGGANVGYAAAPNLRIPDPPRGAYQQPQQSPHRQQQAFGVQGAAQGGESYFYSPVNADVIPGAGDQQHHHSSYNFVQQYQPAEAYSATTYTPNSDFTNLPSSVSTPSVGGGTDDGQLTYSSASSHAPQRPSAQQAQSSSSRNSSGAATRGTGRRGKPAAKRQREEIQDGDDSDTQSDDEQPPTLSGLNMTVNVPPPQGQNSLPGRL
ncbi:hypothetical protein VTO73DRAFT_4069 [Trametes versicolor]